MINRDTELDADPEALEGTDDDPTKEDSWEPPYDPHLNESVLIDYHRTSVFPEVRAVVDALMPAMQQRPGVSSKVNVVRKHLKLVLLNLYAAWKLYRWVAYPADSRVYSDLKGRYNKLRITRQLPTIMRALEESGYVEIKKGFKDKGTGKGFMSRAKATDKLINLFAPIKPGMVQVPQIRECIIMTKRIVAEDGSLGGKEHIDYQDTPETVRMRESLYHYNKLIHNSDIAVPGMVSQTFNIDLQKKFTYRVFNRGSFDVGGRFYGPWWVTLPGIETPTGKISLRRFIEINGNPVVELDYRAQHPSLLYARKGLSLPDDPYTIEGVERDVVKQALLITLNASERQKVLPALHKWANEKRKHPGLADRFKVPQDILEAIERKHEPISDFFYKEAWTFLQRQDSDIAERVMNHFTAMGIPMLMIHDSFIVARPHRDELEEVMIESMVMETGRFGAYFGPTLKEGW